MTYAQSEDTDQPWHLPSLVVAVRMKNIVLLATHSVHSLRWAHRSFCCFCRATAHMIVIL